MTRDARLMVLFLMVILAFGCGENNTDGIIVRGKVTYQGQPIAGGVINFFPRRGQPLGGAIQSDGGFEFRLPYGDYRVTIRESAKYPDGWKEGDPMPLISRSALPPHYGRPDTSGLSLKIAAQDEPRVVDYSLD